LLLLEEVRRNPNILLRPLDREFAGAYRGWTMKVQFVAIVLPWNVSVVVAWFTTASPAGRPPPEPPPRRLGFRL
jgi:hypothetical protein